MSNKETFILFIIIVLIILDITFVANKTIHISDAKSETFQIDYIQDSIEHHMLLNVHKIKPDCYIVDSQEVYDTLCPIIITKIFNYDETF